MAISNRTKLIFVTLLLFFLVLPLSVGINFAQNDDHLYYFTVRDFLQGKFGINAFIDAAFYTQGIMGVVFSKVFGLEKLPILTLGVSVLNFAIFTKLVNDYYLKKFHEALLVGLLFFLTPFHLYSSLGFMTENYFVFFFLVSIWFTEKFLRATDAKSERLNFVLSNIFMVGGFFVRQVSIITSLALAVYLLVKRRYRWAAAQFGIAIGLLIYYFEFFSKTANKGHKFYFANILNLQQTYSFVLMSLIYLSAFTIPLAILLFYQKRKLTKNRLIVLATLILFLIISVTLPANLNPKFFYFKNTVEQNGFFYGDLLGNKYEIQYQPQIYFFWELVAKFSLALTLVMFLINRKKLAGFYLIYALLYLGLISTKTSVYDRYLLALIPVSILIVLSIKDRFTTFSKLVLIVFLVWLSVLGYNFSMEFVSLNNILWKVSNNLVRKQGVRPEKISAGYAWRQTYPSQNKEYQYVFYFEPKDTVPKLDCCFKLLETYPIRFPYSIFKDPKVFLYTKTL